MGGFRLRINRGRRLPVVNDGYRLKIGALFDYRHKHSNRLMPPGVEFLLLLS